MHRVLLCAMHTLCSISRLAANKSLLLVGLIVGGTHLSPYYVAAESREEQAQLREERDVLFAFKAAITHDPLGDIWRKWTGSTPCGTAEDPPWAGVRCARPWNAATPRVWGINLSNKTAGCFLEGSIPSELGRLTNLLSIDIGQCGFSGMLPPEITTLPKLEYLILSGNKLSGVLPTDWNAMTDLKTVDLSGNQGLQGGLPTSLGNLKSLRRLVVSGTGVTGPIPTELGGLTQLTQLELGHNQLTSTIPSELPMLTKLSKLSFAGNHLVGSIPEALGALTNLEELDLSAQRRGEDSGLTGALPAWLGDLSNLKQLDLHYNSLSGGIPNSLAKLTNLEVLNLASNGLTGSVPQELSRLTNLTALYLNKNNFSGSVKFLTEETSNLDSLMYAYLGENTLLCGAIPVNQSAGPWVEGTRVGIQSISTTTNGAEAKTWDQCPEASPTSLPATPTTALASMPPDYTNKRAVFLSADEKTAGEGSGSVATPSSRKSQAALVSLSDVAGGNMATSPQEKVNYVVSQGQPPKVNNLTLFQHEGLGESGVAIASAADGGRSLGNPNPAPRLDSEANMPARKDTSALASASGEPSANLFTPPVPVKRDRAANLLKSLRGG